MRMRLKNLAVVLIVATILLSFIQANINRVLSIDSGGKIDLFTQKEPFSGKGLNMPSDAFGPGDRVVLYALTTYSDMPVQDLIVSFYVRSQDNKSFTLTARTNASGIAAIKFTIPQINATDSEIFGNWFASANALIKGFFLQDTLTFKVDWIVKLVSIKTIDENVTYRTFFGLKGYVGLEIVLRSIAMKMKNATIAIVIQDELQVPISYSEISDFDVPPNEKLVFLYSKLYIPHWAYVGNATVFVSVLNSVNGSKVPYSPTISTNFFITSSPPLTIALHDVAVVNSSPSANSVEVGQPANINVIVRNEGTEIESFDVNAYLNAAFIGTQHVVDLTPYLTANLNFTFDTSMMNIGNYTVTISIPYLSKEADLTDNFFVDGVIEIKPESPAIIHDIAIVNVTTSNNSIYIGQTLQINVSIVNKGTETESFDVKTYYGSSLIEILRVSSLAPNTQTTLISVWNTSFVKEGFYVITASAPLPGDVFPSDNTFVDGVVQVKARPIPSAIHDVAVLNVTSSTTFAYIGQVINITVFVKNKGTATESCSVTAFYNSTEVETLLVNSLEPGHEKQLVFRFNTQNVKAGHYVLSAYATPVPNEQNTEDNYFRDGVVEISAAPEGFILSAWLLGLLLLLLILLTILLIAWFYRRKKLKETKKSLSFSVEVPACFKS